VRWSTPDTYHLTIRFIGESSETEADAYRDALTSVDAAAAHIEPFGLGVLPSRLSPRVVMCGSEQTRSLSALYAEVSEALEDAGLDEADNAFRPHVTIGRIRDADPEAVHHALREASSVHLPAVTVRSLTLYRSRRGPDGARHEVVETVPLASS
ncbi:RNA 2',3'-cyclic phosphodiesterase, partial [Longibacter sp.]|uniref:RNA 2',3'-cyclic phosphodiesterase n=1 Tax=Longibacter sp. TaxID=2045415 RepID=UPI003EB7E206